MLTKAYGRLDYTQEQVTESLTVPTANPAYFNYATNPAVTDAEFIHDQLTQSRYAFIDVMADNGDAWYEFHVSAKVYDDSTNEFAKVKITTSGVSFFKSNEDLSYETFVDLVDLVKGVLQTELELEPKEDDDA